MDPATGWALGIVALLLGAGLVYEFVGELIDARRFPPPGRLVDIGGRRLHTHLLGEGRPAVVLESGIGATRAACHNLTPMAPQRVSRYRILGKLGSGGMGDVYLADDPTLRRKVALKILPDRVAADPARRSRFIREAIAASRLAHPNICVVYDAGEAPDAPAFISMEYVEGETLRARLQQGPMGIGETVGIAMQIADALEEAHRRGIVHRDVKPGNIMIDARGRVKVLDFGLAKIYEPGPAGDAETESAAPETAAGMVSGTIQYMSPEQAHGRAVDRRSDLFSLGLVLYEMVTGRHPFAGASNLETLSRIAQATPLPPARARKDCPPDLERVILKCLEKDRDQRYQTAGELLRHLERTRSATRPAGGSGPSSRRPVRTIAAASLAAALAIGAYAVIRQVVRPASPGVPAEPGTAATAERPLSLAVLPFQIFAAEPELRQLSLGVADAITTRVSNLSQLRVRPTGAILRYTEQAADLRQVGRELESDYLLAGTLRQSGDRLRASVQIVRTSDGTAVWGQSFDLAKADLITLEDQIAERVSGILPITVTVRERERLARTATRIPEAYEGYLRGRAALLQLTRQDTLAAVEAFESALELDPQYGRARAGLATAAAQMGIRFAGRDEVALWQERARREATDALRLNPDLAEAHEALASLYRYSEFDWDRTMEESTRALSLNHNLELPHYYRAAAAMHLGLLDLAEREARVGMEINPSRPIEALRLLGVVALLQGRFDEATDALGEVAARTDIADYFLGLAHYYRGEVDEAVDVLQRLGGGETRQLRAVAALSSVLAAQERRREAGDLLHAVEATARPDHHVAYSAGAAYAQLGRPDDALRWLQLAATTGFPCAPWFGRDPLLDPLASDRRFVQLLANLGAEHSEALRRYSPLETRASPFER